jgi:xanthine/CO dehydrogenase XdhC/CoxF family maturation factor
MPSAMSGLDALAGAAEVARAERPTVPLAIATLVAVDGSSYRQPGARLLVDAEGRVLAGAISGGCLEGDVAAHAAAVCATGIPRRLTYDLGDDLQAIWGFGAMCSGIAHLLLEPLGDGTWLADAHRLREARGTGTLLTVLHVGPGGGTRLLPGAERLPDALVDPTAESTDRSAPNELIRAAHATMRPVLGTVPLAIGPTECLLEPVVPPVSLVLVGATRGAEAFATIACALGWRVTVIDHREAILAALVVPDAVARIEGHAETALAQVTRDQRTAVALLTHQFALDQGWLTALLPLPIAYVGLLGSRQRARQLVEALANDGLVLSDAQHRRLHAPIGLDLGGESPESIALAAIAEIEAVLHGRPGGSLRDRHSPIHARTPTPGPMEPATTPTDTPR